MWASLRDCNAWTPRAAVNFVFSRACYDATIRSAAVYKVLSLSLFATLYLDPNILFYLNMSILSPLMVRRGSAHKHMSFAMECTCAVIDGFGRRSRASPFPSPARLPTGTTRRRPTARSNCPSTRTMWKQLSWEMRTL